MWMDASYCSINAIDGHSFNLSSHHFIKFIRTFKSGVVAIVDVMFVCLPAGNKTEMNRTMLNVTRKCLCEYP